MMISRKKVTFLRTLLYIAGIVGFVALPRLSRNIYFSENALSPGNANPSFTEVHYRTAKQLDKDFSAIRFESSETWIARLETNLRSYGVETYRQQFEYEGESFTNVVGVVRAPQGDGMEAMAVSSRFGESPANCAIFLALAKALSEVNWLSKDVVFIATDSRLGVGVGVANYLHAYHYSHSETFPRVGAFRGAVVVHLDSFNFNSISLGVVGAEGNLPNLDLVNVAQVLSLYHHRIQPFFSEHDIANADWWGRGIEILEPFRNLFRFATAHAFGVPSGDHSAFLRYNIDAVSLSGVTVDSLGPASPENLFKFGKVVDGVLRCVNNLLEKFHQSFYFYLIPDLYRYIPIGDYAIPLALIWASLNVEVIYLFYTAPKGDVWHSVSVVAVASAVGASLFVVSLGGISDLLALPLHHHTVLQYWSGTALASVLLLFLVGFPQIDRLFGVPRGYLNPHYVKSFALGAFSAVVVVVACSNYSFAVFGAIALTPLCFLVSPTSSMALKLPSLLLVLATSPAGLIVLYALLWARTSPWAVLERVVVLHASHSSLFLAGLCLILYPLTVVFLRLCMYREDAQKPHSE